MNEPDPDHRLAAQLRALAHPARLALVRALAEHDGCTCGALVSALPLAQSTVSEHLRVLKDAGLIMAQADAGRGCYMLNRAGAAELVTNIARLADSLGGCAARPEKMNR